jgi:hypothetical protein
LLNEVLTGVAEFLASNADKGMAGADPRSFRSANAAMQKRAERFGTFVCGFSIPFVVHQPAPRIAGQLVCTPGCG